MCDEYLFPSSVAEALGVLQSYQGEARIIARGTVLVPELKEQIRDVKCLVDISEIKELKKIEQDGDYIRIGAGVTHQQAASSKLIREKAIGCILRRNGVE